MLLHHSRSKNSNGYGASLPVKNRILKGNLSSINPLNNLSEIEGVLTDSQINLLNPLRQSVPDHSLVNPRDHNEDSLVKIRSEQEISHLMSNKAKRISMFGVGSI